MIVVYDKKDRKVVTSLAVNTILGDVAISDLLVKMFPSTHGRLGCAEISYALSNPVNCDVELFDGMLCAVTRDGCDLYRLDPEELKRIAEEKRDEERGALVRALPFKRSTALDGLLFRRFGEMHHTLSETKEALADNSWFKRRIDVVGWWGSFIDAGGYANMNREIVQRLHNYNILPYISIYPTLFQMDPETMKILKMYSHLKPKNHDHPYVYAFTPMPHERHPGKRIFFTMMETSSLHPDFANYCNMYSDEIWVPSRANRQLFLSNGVTKPIRVIPLGIDELFYFPEESRKQDFPMGDCIGIFGRDPLEGIANFKFLTLIQWNMRKGYDALIKAFINAFDDKDDVCLVIVTQYAEEIVSSTLWPFLPRRNNLPQVVLYNRIIPIATMPDIYRGCDAYVHMSRGEGFSLTQIEAASQGLPVISCFHSGMTEYLTPENSFPIECLESEPCDPRLAQISYFYQNQTLWKVGPQQVDQAVDYMRFVHENYGEAQKKAEILRERARREYTWRRCTERVAEALRA